ncbi:hypothetical protein [Leptolyngbya sp. FACHB-261]|uniref:hypothetical protein n=1 Tax=Leptolyngbya sp. FACHB-261 TaxID=2692806 RepID=UPI001F54B8B3|nr:hypothetical protein [Leptolyngbya sp. FACHB-261]
MKYFFLAQGWHVGRIWAAGGLWSETAWRRKPRIELMGLYPVDQGESMWLYRVEDAVLMVEVTPESGHPDANIGQVVLKRLITADQALERITALSPTEASSAARPEAANSGIANPGAVNPGAANTDGNETTEAKPPLNNSIMR